MFTKFMGTTNTQITYTPNMQIHMNAYMYTGSGVGDGSSGGVGGDGSIGADFLSLTYGISGTVS
jgi:hypothetical protein